MISRIRSQTSSLIQFQERILFSLTPLQKRVAAVAIAILAVIAIATYYVMRTYFQAQPIALEKQEHHQNLASKLARNGRFAKLQQESEREKNFRIIEPIIPDVIPLMGANGTVREKPILSSRIAMRARQVGHASCEGARESMEDADIATEEEIQIGKRCVSIELFGIFDGHGGPHASAFVQTRIVDVLKEKLEGCNPHDLSDEGINRALKETFRKLHSDFEESFEGTTATIALIIDDNIWIANVGDSRAILSKNGKGTQASEDAKPTNPRYKKKVEKLGGEIICKRVMGYLAVASAIGDKKVVGRNGKSCVSSDPTITRFLLNDFQEGYLILACDGLYDVATTNEVSQAIHLLASQNNDEAAMAKSLVYHAIARHGSKDNVSVMVIRL